MSKVIITALDGVEVELDSDAEVVVNDNHFVVIDDVGRIFIPFHSVLSIWVDKPGRQAPDISTGPR